MRQKPVDWDRVVIDYRDQFTEEMAKKVGMEAAVEAAFSLKQSMDFLVACRKRTLKNPQK